jgi:hypothetical protein
MVCDALPVAFQRLVSTQSMLHFPSPGGAKCGINCCDWGVFADLRPMVMLYHWRIPAVKPQSRTSCQWICLCQWQDWWYQSQISSRMNDVTMTRRLVWLNPAQLRAQPGNWSYEYSDLTLLDLVLQVPVTRIHGIRPDRQIFRRSPSQLSIPSCLTRACSVRPSAKTHNWKLSDNGLTWLLWSCKWELNWKQSITRGIANGRVNPCVTVSLTVHER